MLPLSHSLAHIPWVDVTVKWNGLQRKVHPDITYGKPWTGSWNKVFDGGDGTQANPYMIHNANQLSGALDGDDKWNKEGNKKQCYFKLANPVIATGICYNAPATMEYCLSTGRVENFNSSYGISDGEGTNCHYDMQMMAGEDSNQEIGSTTAEILSGNLMGSSAWRQDEDHYPMLEAFANTPYGKLLAMPVLFDDTDDTDGIDKAGNVSKRFVVK